MIFSLILFFTHFYLYNLDKIRNINKLEEKANYIEKYFQGIILKTEHIKINENSLSINNFFLFKPLIKSPRTVVDNNTIEFNDWIITISSNIFLNIEKLEFLKNYNSFIEVKIPKIKLTYINNTFNISIDNISLPKLSKSNPIMTSIKFKDIKKDLEGKNEIYKKILDIIQYRFNSLKYNNTELKRKFRNDLIEVGKYLRDDKTLHTYFESYNLKNITYYNYDKGLLVFNLGFHFKVYDPNKMKNIRIDCYYKRTYYSINKIELNEFVYKILDTNKLTPSMIIDYIDAIQHKIETKMKIVINDYININNK